MAESFQSYDRFRPAFEAGSVSSRQAVEYFLSRIATQNPHLNAFIEVYEEEALRKADEADQRKRENRLRPLEGFVLAIKDNLSYRGHVMSASSRILEGFEAIYTATAIDRLEKAGAIVIGRCNCDEFAMGGSNENSWYGPVRNAHDSNRVPGGSSGGSAVAVQAGLCMAALGTDTGGSVRQPASFTGTVGLRPSYGRISRYGLYAFASSLDQIGTLSHTVEDSALLLAHMAGEDACDATSAPLPAPIFPLPEAPSSYRLVYLHEAVQRKGLDVEVKDFHENLFTSLAQNGHQVEAGDFPYMEQVVPTYYVVANAEASSNLSRYAGMLYGFRASGTQSLQESIVESRSQGFGTEVQRRIMLGTFVLSEGYYDAYYAKAQKVRRLITQQLRALLEQADALILPTTAGTAFALGAHYQDPVAMYLEDIFTVQAALAGLPAISLPLGVHSNGLPFGVQLIGAPYKEETLLSLSALLMRAHRSQA